MDVIVSAGLNYLQHMSKTSFISLAESFKTEGIAHNKSSTFTVVGIMNTPKYVWYETNTEERPPGHINHREKILAINIQLKKMSTRAGSQSWVSFESEGCRTIRRRNHETGTMSLMTQHQITAWREFPDLKRCLHLEESKRVKLLPRIIKFL